MARTGSLYRRREKTRIHSFQPNLEPRVCGNQADMGQSFIARDMGRFRIFVDLTL